MSQEQITAILAGKPVVASPREIQEARNAIQAYDRIATGNLGRKRICLIATAS